MELQLIQNKIYEIRGQKVMIDYDLAQMYMVETRVLNQGVKRNSNRFPIDFMFQLTLNEFEALQMSSQIVMTSKSKRPNKSLPYVFTEHGVAMLAGILKSDIAVNVNIAIIRAFIEMKKQISHYAELAQKIHTLENLTNSQFIEVYEALENLINDTQILKGAQKKKVDFENRELIGFKQNKK
jgi:hypothetical protein